METLAAALANGEDFEKAVATQKRVLELAPTEERVRAKQILELYQHELPYRENALAAKASTNIPAHRRRSAEELPAIRTPRWPGDRQTGAARGQPPAAATAAIGPPYRQIPFRALGIEVILLACDTRC